MRLHSEPGLIGDDPGETIVILEVGPHKSFTDSNTGIVRGETCRAMDRLDGHDPNQAARDFVEAEASRERGELVRRLTRMDVLVIVGAGIKKLGSRGLDPGCPVLWFRGSAYFVSGWPQCSSVDGCPPTPILPISGSERMR